MRILGFLLVLVSFIVVAPASHAGPPKMWIWGWWPSHWQNQDFKPYLNNQQIKNRGLWDNDTWTPERWIEDAGDAKYIMRDLYAGGIITDQRQSDNIPVLEVGNAFFRLSSTDRIRVLRFIDYLFEVTKDEENGMFYIYAEGEDDLPVGIYDKRGFQQY